MDKIISNPGLQHLAEKVFWNLDVEDLKICAQINQSCKQILQNPVFCLGKLKHLSKKNRSDWINVIQSVKNSDKGIAIIAYMKWNLKKGALLDLPCYSSPTVQDDFRNTIRECCNKKKSSTENTEIVKILAPLTENPNAADRIYNSTPIYWAAIRGQTEIVKILAPLTNTPNSPSDSTSTPIHWAVLGGHEEIVRILAPLTGNPNAPNVYGETPLHGAVVSGHIEIVKFLATLTNNLNCPDRDGGTPIYYAAWQGHTEIVKILVHLTDNPNAPNKHGVTPFAVAKRAEIRGILEAFETSRKYKAGSSIKSHTRFFDELIYHFKNNVKKIPI